LETKNFILKQFYLNNFDLKDIIEGIIDHNILRKNDHSEDNCSMILINFDKNIINKCTKTSKNIFYNKKIGIDDLILPFNENESIELALKLLKKQENLFINDLLFNFLGL
jgi:hypothetical protein